MRSFNDSGVFCSVCPYQATSRQCLNDVDSAVGGAPYYDVRGARGSGRTLKESREKATASSLFKYLFFLRHFSCFCFCTLRICHRSSQPKRFLYVIFDLETTGLSRQDRIMQLAFCLVDNDKKFVSNESLSKPPHSFLLHQA